MEYSTAQKVGIALIAGSVVVVCLQILFILIGLDAIRGWWGGGIDIIFELAGGIRETLFGVE